MSKQAKDTEIASLSGRTVLKIWDILVDRLQIQCPIFISVKCIFVQIGLGEFFFINFNFQAILSFNKFNQWILNLKDYLAL